MSALPPNAVPVGGRRVIGWLRASIVAAVVLPTVLFLLVARQSHVTALDDARTRVDRAARIADGHLTRVIETDEVIARQLVSALGDRSDAQILADQVRLNADLRQLTAGLVQIQSVWVWDRDGRPLVTNRFDTVPRALDVSDREYFRALRAPGSTWYVSETLQSRSTGEPFFDVSRRREAPDGSFAGVISVSLRPDYFTRFYAELARAEPGLVVTLAREDGRVITRHPANDPSLGDVPLPDQAALQRLRDGERGMIFTTPDSSRQPRYAVARRVSGLPLYVIASLERGQMLAGWTGDAALLAAFTFPTALALAYVSLVALRLTRRELAAVSRLTAESDQRRRAEEALRQAQKLEALGQLTGGVAHDFNNLLMIVHNSLHLHTRLMPAAAGTKPVDAIFRAVAAGAKLTRQLLAFSRRQALRPTVIDLRQALPAISELVRTTVGRRVVVSEHISADVPRVEVDSAELELAMLNLAINARDAMAQGGRLAIIARTATEAERPDPAGSYAVISVSDTGRGVSAEHLGRVFEPFFTTKGPGHGTGLGLSQVYGFCAQAGGTARMESQPGVGTTVFLVLPATGKPVEAPAPAPVVAEHSLAGRVLLVEDNLELAAVTQPLLERLGCTVVHAPSAEAALQALAGPVAVDVVVSDIVMPGRINGLDLALLLRNRQPRLPVVLMTGYAAEIHRAMAAGFELLAKPVTAEALANTLSRLLGGKGGAAPRTLNGGTVPSPTAPMTYPGGNGTGNGTEADERADGTPTRTPAGSADRV